MADEEERVGSRVVPPEETEEGGFDPALKKKKKKKKKPTTFDETPAEAAPAQADAPPADEVDDPYAVVTDESLAKKKKKKKVAMDVEDGAAEGGAAATPEAGDGEEVVVKKKKKKKKILLEDEDAEGEEDVDAGLDNEFGEKKKKKKKKKKKVVEEDAAPAADADANDAEDVLPWAGSDREYTYKEMLTRVQRILQERNPSLAAGEKKRFLMKPPKVVREGTKKTVFLNFAEICKIMNRSLDHVYQFILVELGTSGSLDGQQRMVIKGRFQPKAIENILRRYVVEYLTCHSCKSPDTILKKDNRLFFLVCNQCGAQRSVATIKHGFQAQIGKRKKL